MQSDDTIRRRAFLQGVTGAGLAAAVPAQAAQAEPLPLIRLGDKQVTRLIAGGNPIGGYSYGTPKLTQHMLSYFTVERTAEFILHCERQGINTFQSSYKPLVGQALRIARERGSKIQFILLASGFEQGIPKEVMETNPIAVCHHGGVTDRLFRAGKHDAVREFVKRIKGAGMLAGVSSHNPDHIAYVEDAGWENDLYMTCFYNLTRTREEMQQIVREPLVGEPYLFFAADPERMVKRIREVKKPCLAYKILAAGRRCGNAKDLDAAFSFAYGNIKPTDAAIVGMYPVFADEPKENADLTRKYARPS